MKFKRLLACLLAVVLCISVFSVGALAAGENDWTTDDAAKTVAIYTADGLRAWADSITNGKKSYDGYTISIENDIDLSDKLWEPIYGLGGNVTINGNNHTINNMNISRDGNRDNYVGSAENNTYLGFIGDLNYNTTLTVKDITFDKAHVQDTRGDWFYSWCGVVVGHGAMDSVVSYNTDCIFENVNISNSVVTGGHNNGAIMGYCSSTESGHVFDHCTVTNTFVGGYNSTSGILFGMGNANVTVRNCSANGVRLYTDGLNFHCAQSDNNQLWVGNVYPRTGGGAVYEENTNTTEDTYVVYPVFYHYTNETVKEYVKVNTDDSLRDGVWYSNDSCDGTPVTRIIAALSNDMYPYGEGYRNMYGHNDNDDAYNKVNDEAFETQNTDLIANPLTHGAIDLYTNVPNEGKTSYPGLEKWIIDGTNEDGSENLVKKDTDAAGDKVDFKLVSNVPEDLTNYLKPEDVVEPGIQTLAFDSEKNGGVYKLTFHDTMDSALTLDKDSFKVSIGDKLLTLDEDYTITYENEDACTFEVSMDLVDLFEKEYFTEADFGTAEIIVTYSATAKEDITAGKYYNTAWVEYEGGDTEEDIVEVDTYKISIFKYDQATAELDEEGKLVTATGLAGAKFELYQKDAGGNIIPDSVVELISDKDGYTFKDGLDAGTYYIKEIEAPNGYVKSDNELEVVISADGNYADNTVTVNFANAPVPHTGGAGTTMYTIIGICILAAAGVVFILSQKKKQIK